MGKINDCGIFIIKALTNMHVGSGDINFGVIDNMVQRDATTHYPGINGSSLKGALREHFKFQLGVDDDRVKMIFGAEASDEMENNNSSGDYKFFEARLLALPVRSMKEPYFLATCPYIIKELIEYTKLFGDEGSLLDKLQCLSQISFEDEKGYLIDENCEVERIEVEDIGIKVVKPNDYHLEIKEIQRIFGTSKIVILDNKIFNECIANNLPVVARNHLKNHISKNLWYEEIVPRETMFYVGIWKQSNGKSETVEFEEVTQLLEKEVIQIGANASIGYGYTEFRQLGGE